MPNNAELVELLNAKFDAFKSYLNSLSDEELIRSVDSKWNALEHAEHLYRSLKLLPPLYATPSFLLLWKFGKANRPSRTYQEIVQKYQDKLATKDVSNNPFAAKKGKVLLKKEIDLRLESTVKKLNKQLLRISPKKLDLCILPHPLLGKITLREMALFSAYHIEHHLVGLTKSLHPERI